MQLTTSDQAAVAVLLSGVSEQEKQTHLGGLVAETRVTHGLECPDCHAVNVCDNGLSGVDLTFLCADCGHQWSPNI